jgi:hypothetical protein
MLLEEVEVPVPVADVDVTFVGVTTMTFEDSEVLVIDELVLLIRTGPFTPLVFVVVAFVVDVDPFTTVTGPRAPEVPVVCAACEFVGAKKTTITKHNTALRKLRDFLIDTGSFKRE